MYAVYVQNLFVSRLGRTFALVYAKNAGIWAMCKVLDNTRTQFTACLCFTLIHVDCVRRLYRDQVYLSVADLVFKS